MVSRGAIQDVAAHRRQIDDDEGFDDIAPYARQHIRPYAAADDARDGQGDQQPPFDVLVPDVRSRRRRRGEDLGPMHACRRRCGRDAECQQYRRGDYAIGHAQRPIDGLSHRADQQKQKKRIHPTPLRWRDP